MTPFVLRLYRGDQFVSEAACTAFSLEREAYTPFNTLTAVFASEGTVDLDIDRIGLFREDSQIFLGLADEVSRFQKNGRLFTKVSGKSFTSLLTQNELEKGLYFDITIGKLVKGYYDIPFVSYENDSTSGYINVKDGTNLWDCIVCFGFKLKRHYPFVADNHIFLSPPDSAKSHTIPAEAVLEYGSVLDTTKIISHCHMEDLEGNENAYFLENAAASEMNVVRHKYINFDRQFLRYPQDALNFRIRYSMRGWKAKYVVYEGFRNEELGEKISCGDFLNNQTICRVLFTFGQNGLRTKIWSYEDGFYQ